MTLALLLALPAAAQQQNESPAPPPQQATSQPTTAQQQAAALDRIIDRIIAGEQATVDDLRNYSPLIEAYVQETRPDAELGSAPRRDHYFLGKAMLAQGVVYARMDKNTAGFWRRALGAVNVFSRQTKFRPTGFLQMIYVDPLNFNRETYEFEYVRREFVGEVRCLVFDVKPLEDAPRGSFLGRIWAEDQGFRIVRFNGVYSGGTTNSPFFHMDSWRINVAPGKWLPAFIYSEESEGQMRWYHGAKANFRAQIRLWGYNLADASKETEFSQLLIEADNPVVDQSETSPDRSPLEAQRLWYRQAEDNVLERLTTAGLLSPPGDVDKVLSTVLNNLLVTNELYIEPELRARVLLTSRLEAFTIGHTIVVSRGLIDVLPDEPSLAAVLAQQLGHVLSGHPLDSDYAFSDRFIFPDEQTLKRINFERSEEELAQAGAKGFELVQNSPYKEQLGKAGLFFAALSHRATELPGIIHPNLGNGVILQEELLAAAPALEMANKEQISALPLGSRVKVDPWTSQAALMQAKPVSLLSAREKMPFELAPFMPYLTRYRQSASLDPSARPGAAESKPVRANAKPPQ
ncbi:MAG: M48 family metalloprotease [Candidatus Acidiferrales bacterium]